MLPSAKALLSHVRTKTLTEFRSGPVISARLTYLAICDPGPCFFPATADNYASFPPGGFMPFLVRTLRSAAYVSIVVPFFCGILIRPARAQNTAPGPNSDPTYQSLRNLTLASESISVNNLELKR